MEKLVELSLENYAEKLDSSLPAPGGGSSSAYLGVMGISLARMYAHLSFGKKKFEERPETEKEAFKNAFDRLLPIKEAFFKAVDDDALLYGSVIGAYRLPKDTEEEKEIRERKIQEALILAAKIPLNLAELAYDAMKLIAGMIPLGNQNVAADAYTALDYLHTVIVAESYNILANAKSLKDPMLSRSLTEKIRDLAEKSAILLQNAKGDCL